MESGGTHKLQLKTVDQISIAVKDIDEVIETWSSMFGIGPWTFRDIGGTDAKGRSWLGGIEGGGQNFKVKKPRCKFLRA